MSQLDLVLRLIWWVTHSILGLVVQIFWSETIGQQLTSNSTNWKLKKCKLYVQCAKWMKLYILCEEWLKCLCKAPYYGFNYWPQRTQCCFSFLQNFPLYLTCISTIDSKHSIKKWLKITQFEYMRSYNIDIFWPFPISWQT